MKCILLLIAGLCLLWGPALAQSPVTTFPAGWKQSGDTKSISTTTSSSRVQLGWGLLNPIPNPPPVIAWVCNWGSDNVYIALGTITVAATSASTPLLAGSCNNMVLGGATYAAAIAVSSTATVTIATGTGSTAAGGLGSSGGLGVFMTTSAGNATAGATINLGLGGGNANISRATMNHWRAAVARVKAGTGRGRLLVMSDSTSAGAGAGTSGGGINLTGAYALAWPGRLATWLTTKGVPTSDCSLFTDQNASGIVSYNAYDPRATLGASWNFSATSLGGLLLHYASGTAGTFSLAPGAACPFDTFTIFYLQNGVGFDTFTVNIDGGSSLGTVDPNHFPGIIASQTFTVAKGAHTINIVPNNLGGGVANFIYGILVYDSTTPAIDIIRAARIAGQVSDFTTITPAQLWSPIPLITTTVQPDAAILALTINDSNAASPGVVPAAYSTGLQAIITAVSATGDTILGSGPPSGTANGTNGTLAAFVAAEKVLTISNNASFVDIVGRWGSYVAINTVGLFPYFDTLHPKTLGYWDVGLAYAEALSTP